MNIKVLRFGISFALIGIIFYVFIPNAESSPFPKGRSGGGSRGGGRSSYSGSSYSRGGRGSSSYGGSKSSGGSKSKGSSSGKSFVKKHWKKAAAFGAGAYIGYKGYKGLKKV